MSSPLLVSSSSSAMTLSSTATSSILADGDANTALAELEQGLRSSRPGEVCESIVRFPRLLSEFPFPILVNSALLKLADVFRTGDNLAKMCVVRVVTVCSSQLCVSKTLNVGEFTRRVTTVSHANDPVARSLVLRLLAALAEGVSQYKHVLHLVQEALDSNDLVELAAALDAASALAELNAAFAKALCSKAAERIERLATPLNVKLRLVHIFRHMHHDSHTAQIARARCLSMLSSYPSSEFTLALLSTLTSLNSKTLVHLSSHIDLLLSYLSSDPRRSIRMAVIKHLYYLASEAYSHLWSDVLTSKLISVANSMDNNDRMMAHCTAVVTKLAETVPDVQIFFLEDEQSIVDLWRQACASQSLIVAAEGCKLVAGIGARCTKDNIHIKDVDVLDEACMSAEALFLLIQMLQQDSNPSSDNEAILKECLWTMVRLSKCRQECVDQLVSLVSSHIHVQPLQTLHFLLALGSQKKGVLRPLMPDLHRLSSSDCMCGHNYELNVALATLFCQAYVGQRKWPQSSLGHFHRLSENVDDWHAFKLARAAMRYGHHYQVQTLLRRVYSEVSSENTLYYMEAMMKLSEGESILGDDQRDLAQRITEANSKIIAANTSLAAAVTQNKTMNFQIEFLGCRSEFLQTLSQLAGACHSLLTSPPPAIAASNRNTVDEALHKCGRIVLLLRKACEALDECGSIYEKFGQTLFDSDAGTIEHVRIMQALSVKLAKWIRLTCGLATFEEETVDNAFFSFDRRTLDEDGSLLDNDLTKEAFLPVSSLEVQELNELGKSVGEQFASLQRDIEEKTESTAISHRQIATLMNAVEILASRTSFYPRYFFQALQRTTIKLSIAPQPKVGESLSVCVSQQLAMRIEGVLVVERKSVKASRCVRKVLLRLQITPGVKEMAAKDGSGSTKESFEELVEPVDNFFSAQFLLPFSQIGNHHVSVETQLVDDEGGKWDCEGARVVISVKVFEDLQARQSNRPSTSSSSSNR